MIDTLCMFDCRKILVSLQACHVACLFFCSVFDSYKFMDCGYAVFEHLYASSFSGSSPSYLLVVLISERIMSRYLCSETESLCFGIFVFWFFFF